MVLKTLYTNPNRNFLVELRLCTVGMKSLEALEHELEFAFNYVYVGTITMCT